MSSSFGGVLRAIFRWCCPNFNYFAYNIQLKGEKILHQFRFLRVEIWDFGIDDLGLTPVSFVIITPKMVGAFVVGHFGYQVLRLRLRASVQVGWLPYKNRSARNSAASD